MTQKILSPPSQAILDLDKMTLGGTISEDVIVTVPKGLYYAPGSIILRHPNAVLVIESGVRIMFAEHASIRVDYGVLKVLGEMDDPIELTPTQNLTDEYGSSDVLVSTVFNGIYFGANSNGTQVSEGNQYIAGSLLSNCIVKYGGYFQSSASVYLDRTSVMLKNMTVIGDWSRYVYGVYVYNPSTFVLIDEVRVYNAGSIGVYIYSADERVTLTDISVQGCRGDGVNIQYTSSSVIISGSQFHDNQGYQVYVYDSGTNANTV